MATFFGSEGVDSIDGGLNADTIIGGAVGGFGGGNDTLSGNTGADVIFGGDGIDWLLCGVGNDTMTGGTGADVFARGASEGNDRITDFGAGDKVDLTGAALQSATGNVATLSDGSTTKAQAGYVWMGLTFSSN